MRGRTRPRPLFPPAQGLLHAVRVARSERPYNAGRPDDRMALHATRAAVEEGIVPGGGVAYLRCLPALKKLKVEGDRQVGIDIIMKSLEEPIRQIVQNAGQEGSVVA